MAESNVVPVADETKTRHPPVTKLGAVEQALVEGDLSKLSPVQRMAHYMGTCNSLGLNWRTQPFGYLRLNGKLVLYAKRDAADQLRRVHSVTVEILKEEERDGMYLVHVKAKLPSGRCDEDFGAVPIEGLKGLDRANATLKAVTKAKRRVTLSVCGLGMLDETETEAVRGAVVEPVYLPEELEPADLERAAEGDEVLVISEAQYQRLFAFATRLGCSVPKMAEHNQVRHLRELTVAQFKAMVDMLVKSHS